MQTVDSSEHASRAADAGSAGKLFFSISEAADLVDVKAHVLRYWETQFTMLRPKKGRSGSRMYQQRDIELLIAIKKLLYDDGLTIAGARRKLLEVRRAERAAEASSAPRRHAAARILSELRSLSAQLRKPPKRRRDGA